MWRAICRNVQDNVRHQRRDRRTEDRPGRHDVKTFNISSQRAEPPRSRSERFFWGGKKAVVERERDAVEWEDSERRGHIVLSEERIIISHLRGRVTTGRQRTKTI